MRLLLLLAISFGAGLSAREFTAAVYVLPLVGAAGAPGVELYTGVGVQTLVEQMLATDGELVETWAWWQYGKVFPKREDLDRYLRGQAEEPAGVAALDPRWVVRGRMLSGTRVSVTAEDRQTGKRASREVALDFPRLTGFRRSFLAVLEEAGVSIPRNRLRPMMWRENLPPRAMALLGAGWAGYQYAAKEIPDFAEGLKLAPQSYLLLDGEAWAHFRRQDYPAATAGFEAALKRDPEGIDALEGRLEMAAKDNQLATARKASADYAKVRGVAADAPEVVLSLATTLKNYQRCESVESLLEGSAGSPQLRRILADCYVSHADSVTRTGYAAAIPWYQKALAAQEGLDDPRGKARVLGGLSISYLLTNRFPDAIAGYQKMLAILRELKDGAGEAGVLIRLGWAFHMVDDDQAAVRSYQQGLNITRELKDRKLEAQLLNQIAYSFWSAHQYKEAIEWYQKALPIDQELKDRTEEADTLQRLGFSYFSFEQFPEAAGLFEKALVIRRELKDRAGEGDVLLILGTCSYRTQQYEKAIAYYLQARDIAHELKKQPDEARAISAIGDAYEVNKQSAKAIEFYQQALSLRRQMKDRDGEARMLERLGFDYQQQKQKEQALGAYQQALTIRQALKDRDGEAHALGNVAGMYSDLGQFPKAVESYEQARKIWHELKESAKEEDTLKRLSDTATKMGQYAKALTYSEQSFTAEQEQKINAKDRVTMAAHDFELVDHPNPAVLVLPFVAGKGLGEGDGAIGVTLQFLLESALMESPEVRTAFLTQNIRRGFRDLDQWAGFLGGERPPPPFEGFTCVVNGQVEREAEQYKVAMTIRHDDGKVSNATLPVDFPSLQLVRTGFIGELRKAKCGPQEIRPGALWPESLDVAAANVLGLARGDNLAGKISSRPGHVELLDEAARQAPQSILALMNRAFGYDLLGKTAESVALYERTVEMARSFKKQTGEIMMLINLCSGYSDLNQNDKAVSNCEKALEESQAAKNADVESFVLLTLGRVYAAQGKNEQSVGPYEQALRIARQTQNQVVQQFSIFGLAIVHYALGHYEKAVSYYSQAVDLARLQRDRAAESEDLLNLGLCYAGLNQYAKAIGSYTEALAISRELKGRAEQENILYRRGLAYAGLGKFDTAIEDYNQVAQIARELKDRGWEEWAVTGIGSAYYGLNQLERAATYHEQGVEISRERKNRNEEGDAVLRLGIDYAALNQFSKAVDCFTRGLAMAREGKFRNLEGDALNQFGLLYLRVGQKEKAASYYEQALAVHRDLKNRPGEAKTLMSLGGTYHLLGDRKKAVEYYVKALGIATQVKDRALEGNILALIGRISLQGGDFEKSVHYFEEARLIARERKDLGQEITVQFDLGLANLAQKQFEAATSAFQLSLSLSRQLKLPLQESDALTGLMYTFKERGQPRLAIVVGKQVVNMLQQSRTELKTVDATMQQSFTKANEPTYRYLADLLAGQGRLAEAQQVLDMLKEEEFSAFVQRAKDEAPGQAQATLSGQEAEWERRYREIADRLTSTGLRRGSLLAKPDRSTGEDDELAKLESDLEVGNRAFRAFLDSMEEAFRANKPGGEEVVKVKEAEGLMETLRDLGPGTVAVYTVVGEQGYRSILVTPDVQKGYFTAVTAAELNKKILAFREVVRNPTKDPLPLAKELYNLLVKPMEKDLEGAQAQTIMWSLDGALRYVPIAALHDGQGYLVEKYRNVIFTPASQSRLKDAVSRNWHGLGLGVSQAHEGFQALPNVPNELHSIILDDSHAAPGMVPGTVKLDADFTKESLRSELHKHYTVVHMASHFDFVPGTDKNSYLLLGDGGKLTLDEFRSMPQVLQGVELLTLSACDTAVGGEGADGKEVEGFAVLAQRQGAKAVIATLWAVADESTTMLMREFYRVRMSDSKMTKAEALRLAQVALLKGTLKGAESDSRGVKVVRENGGSFVKDVGRPFAHPYFWAPFLLMGNWK